MRAWQVRPQGPPRAPPGGPFGLRAKRAFSCDQLTVGSKEPLLPRGVLGVVIGRYSRGRHPPPASVVRWSDLQVREWWIRECFLQFVYEQLGRHRKSCPSWELVWASVDR